jgi:hypothetical protein
MTTTETSGPSEVLAEVELFHSRPITPTRRLSLGALNLPIDPTPGLGGILLGAIVAAHAGNVHEDLIPDVHRLISQIELGERIVQPRLRHRFQADRHGLARSVHRMIGENDSIRFEFSEGGTPLQHVLGAVYVLERLDPSIRKKLAPLLLKAMKWRGPLNQTFVAYLAGSNASTIAAMADPRAWALEMLGFPPGTVKPSKREIQVRFRESLLDVHPDHGGDSRTASANINDLSEARRVLLNS